MDWIIGLLGAAVVAGAAFYKKILNLIGLCGGCADGNRVLWCR